MTLMTFVYIVAGLVLLVAGAETAGGSPEQFATLLKAETANWAAVIERTGIKPD